MDRVVTDKFVILCAIVAAFTLLFRIGACCYDENITLRLDMAKAGFCYQPVGIAGNQQLQHMGWAYAPCPKQEQSK